MTAVYFLLICRHPYILRRGMQLFLSLPDGSATSIGCVIQHHVCHALHAM